MTDQNLTLTQLKRRMRVQGATQLYLKTLAKNDNSKQQIYLGMSFSVLNILPIGTLTPDHQKPNILKAPLRFGWLTESNGVADAPGTQLILYPQYPEVRLSGFLERSPDAPSELMKDRQPGRLLFLGVNATSVIGFVASHDSALAREVNALGLKRDTGVFSRIPLDIRDDDDRQTLITELARIALSEWINSKRLNSLGDTMQCSATNCGGYTLEAELGIRPNGISDPDFHGWEVKQHAVSSLDRPNSGGPITLMTPEPTHGIYVEKGVTEFIRRFGYADKTSIDRRNFGGIHTALRICPATSLTLKLKGYDSDKQKITDFSEGISLIGENGECAAMWNYRNLLNHWTRKHAKAVYVPSLNRKQPLNQYRYGKIVRLAEGTDFTLFINAVASGKVYYDPGIKIENFTSDKPKIKRRSQFRIRSSDIPSLYKKLELVNVLEH